MTLIDSLIQKGWLKTPRIIEAFRKIKRADFLPSFAKATEGEPEDMKDLAELDEALPIGYGQTISQPLVVAFMMELLRPELGDKVLDIGSGSGWTSALLAEIVGNKGKIVAIEIIPELKEFGGKNVAKYNFIKKGIVEFLCADGSKGYKKEAPFDKILASATVSEEIPIAWKEQLKVGGRIVTPVKDSIWLFIKKSPTVAPAAAEALAGKENEFEEKEFPGFLFVPLIEK